MAVKLTLLGSFQATHATLAENAPVTFATSATRALLAYLAMEGTQPQSRAHLAGLLWSDVPQATAFANLRQTLVRLRKALDAPNEGVLQITAQTVHLNANAISVDAANFEALLAECDAHAHAALSDCPACIARLQQASQLYRGEFLRGLSMQNSQAFEEWVLFRRENLHHKALHVLRVLTRHDEASGNHQGACRHAQRQIELEPWCEEAHQQLMRNLALSGQRSAALAQYEACREVLAAELGIEPSTETTALHEHIRSGELHKPADNATQLDFVRRHDWGDIPATDTLHGRAAELDQLRQWLTEDRCRLVSILGIGGMGKTTLAAAATRAAADTFDVVIWRSLLNAPPLDDILRNWLQVLPRQTLGELPDSLDERLRLLMRHLREQRCLLVLDNVESILQPSHVNQQRAGDVQPGYEGYALLFQRLAESEHNSCLLLTSREQPFVLSRAGREKRALRQLPLSGLDAQAGTAVLQNSGLPASGQDAAALVRHYSGNPLALQLVANTIVDFFDGDVAAFEREERVLFDGIRAVLDQQIERLSDLEHEVLIWLAIEREPVTIQTLQKNLVRKAAMSELLAALNALQARALLEKAGDGLTLQNVVIEYLTEQWVNAACVEIADGSPPHAAAWLHRFALLKAQTKEYVRQGQQRLILQPVADRLLTMLGAPALAQRLGAILDALQSSAPQLQRGYTAGNILNLALQAGLDGSRLHFAGLTLREAFLREHSLAGVDFSNCDLTGAMFGDSFSACHNVTYNSPSGTLAASTSNGEIRLWDADGSRLLSILRGHVKVVWALAGNPKRAQLASGGEDGSVRLWQRASDDGLWLGRVLFQSEAIVRAAAFHPSGEWLASTGDDTHIRLWRTATGDAVCVLHGHSNWSTALMFSPDGRWLASCANDHTVRLWDVSGLGQPGAVPVTHGVLHELPANAPSFWCLAWSPDGRTLACGTLDGNLWVWDVPGNVLLHTGAAHAGMITKLSFNADGAILASAGEDGSIRLWDTHSWQLLRHLQDHVKRVSAIAFHPERPALASVGLDNTVRVWNIERGLATQVNTGRSIGINAIGFGGDDRTLFTANSDGRLVQWALPDLARDTPAPADAPRARLVRTFSADAGVVASMAVDAARGKIITGGHDHSVRVWDARSGELLQALRDHQHIVFGVAFHPDGNTFASSAIDLTTRIWDARSGRCLHVLSHELAPGIAYSGAWSVTYNPNGSLLAVGNTDGTIVLWSLPDVTVKAVLHGHSNWVRGLAFSADGARLVSCSNDGTICIWDARAHALLHTLHGHSDWVMGVALSPDGATIATCSQDQTARLWRMATPEAPPVVLHGHAFGVHKIAFSPSGSLLASNDGSVRIWRSSDGTLLHTLRPPGLYEGMNLTNAAGLSSAQRSVVAHLGAIVSAET